MRLRMPEVIRDPCVRPGLLQQREGRWTVCLTCERRCRLAEGGTGWCRTRRNIGGSLFTLTYGSVSSLSANPIEKKPLYHSNTACPQCGMLLIQRRGVGVTRNQVRSGRCPDCGQAIPGVWEGPSGQSGL